MYVDFFVFFCLYQTLVQGPRIKFSSGGVGGGGG